MTTLIPCPACTRHVRASESVCPFCASALPADLASRAVPGTRLRLDRLAMFTFAASLAVTGCFGSTDDGDTGSQRQSQENDLGGAQALYGMPAPDEDAGPAPDDGKDQDGGGAQALYGMPPPDDHDGGAAQPMYGMPPDDHGGAQPMYGMPAN